MLYVCLTYVRPGFRMDFKDVENFIHEIRKRPVLWDTDSDDYKNRSSKWNAWIEIYKIACPDYGEKSSDERKQIAKDVRLKWKNLRDAYIRYVRLSKAKESTKKGKRRKPYVYSKQMDFLKEIITYRPTRNSYRSTDHRNAISSDSEPIGETIKLEISQSTNPSTNRSHVRGKKRLEDEFQQRQQVQVRQRELQEESDDMSFFRSLLPTLQMLRADQKLTFRIDVMKLLTNYTNSQGKN